MIQIPNFNRTSLCDKSGVSLIIAVIFTAVFLLVMASLYESIYRSISARRNWDMDDKTRYLAESTIELASLWTATNGAGENTEDYTAGNPQALQSSLQLLIDGAISLGFSNCADMDGATGFDPCVNFEVIGRGKAGEKVNLDSDDFFSLPIKGTGNAAGHCTIADTDANSANDPCHWNKLYIGESVDIPLYYETAAGGVVTTDATGGRPAWKLRVRSPLCADVPAPAGDTWSCDLIGGTGRIILYPQPSGADAAPYRDIDKDPVLMQWLIRNADGNHSLIASDEKAPRDEDNPSEANRRLAPYDTDIGKNTELSGGRINEARTPFDLQDFIVLESSYKGENSNDDEVVINAELPSFTRPILHLNLVGQPRRDDDGIPATSMSSASINNSQYKIPYLEYQLLVDSDSPIVSDSKAVLLGKVSIAGFNREVRKYKQGTTTASGFALESF